MTPYTPSQKSEPVLDDEDIEEEAPINRTLYCGDIAPQTTDDELYELFLQAGPLEKVSRPPQKTNMAFVLYKHSITLPYALQLYSDTVLHGRKLRLQFRDGSIHKQRAMGGGRPYHPAAHHASRSEAPRNNSRQVDNSTDSTHHENRFQSSVPQPHIQGYRSSDGGEYVPQYVGQQPSVSVPQYPQFVSLVAPQTSFMGSAPYGHPQHPVSLEDRRDRVTRFTQQANQRHSQLQQDGNRRESARYQSHDPFTPWDRDRRSSNDRDRGYNQSHNNHQSYRR